MVVLNQLIIRAIVAVGGTTIIANNPAGGKLVKFNHSLSGE